MPHPSQLCMDLSWSFLRLTSPLSVSFSCFRTSLPHPPLPCYLSAEQHWHVRLPRPPPSRFCRWSLRPAPCSCACCRSHVCSPPIVALGLHPGPCCPLGGLPVSGPYAPVWPCFSISCTASLMWLTVFVSFQPQFFLSKFIILITKFFTIRYRTVSELKQFKQIVTILIFHWTFSRTLIDRIFSHQIFMYFPICLEYLKHHLSHFYYFEGKVI